mmetsp:Transcript_46972/g.96047  ORF Transcript_46972/g.96047 Transcript_46972/m.96047 type:complete len:243 (-) Transcript_46972:2540-3268(-)
MNISEEKGLNVIREKIKSFCLAPLFNKNHKMKLIILDEADSMNETSQGALCRMIEKFSKNVRFALICNFPSKIIEPIQSRCVILRFKKLKRKISFEFLFRILEKEKIHFDIQSIEVMIFLANGDMRKILNQTEMFIKDSGYLSITEIKKFIPKLNTSELIDFFFNFLIHQEELATEILLDVINQGLSTIDLVHDFLLVLKQIRLKNSLKLKILEFLSELRLDFGKNVFFVRLVSSLREKLEF